MLFTEKDGKTIAEDTYTMSAHSVLEMLKELREVKTDLDARLFADRLLHNLETNYVRVLWVEGAEDEDEA